MFFQRRLWHFALIALVALVGIWIYVSSRVDYPATVRLGAAAAGGRYAALAEALRLHEAEGGNPARLARYQANHAALAEAMEGQGFVPLMDRTLQAPVVISYRDPADPNFKFTRFYTRLRDRGFMIYPGHLTDIPTFRVACIGALQPQDMRDVAAAIGEVCRNHSAVV